MGRPRNRITRDCPVCGTTFTKRPSEMARRPTCSIQCGATCRGLKQQWETACLLLTEKQFLYAGRLPEFDSISGTYRHDPTNDAFYELLDDGTWAKWELQPTSNGFELIQVDDCDADEVPGGALVG